MNGLKSRLQVIMPVYNAQAFIAETLESLINQSVSDWQLLILDDGSTDASLDIIKKYAAIDERILWRSRENLGLIATLNELVDWSTAPILARMDADDININVRFEKQLAFLQRHPDIDMVGCWAELFGARKDVWRFREWDNHTKILSLFGRCCMLHASVLAKREVFEKVAFNQNFPHVEDFVFLSDIITKTSFKFGNVREVLYLYRQHQESIVYQNEQLRKKRYREIQYQHLVALGIELNPDEYDDYWYFLDGQKADVERLTRIGVLLRNIRDKLKPRLSDDFHEFPLRWRQYCIQNKHPEYYSLCRAHNYCFSDERPNSSSLGDISIIG